MSNLEHDSDAVNAQDASPRTPEGQQSQHAPSEVEHSATAKRRHTHSIEPESAATSLDTPNQSLHQAKATAARQRGRRKDPLVKPELTGMGAEPRRETPTVPESADMEQGQAASTHEDVERGEHLHPNEHFRP